MTFRPFIWFVLLSFLFTWMGLIVLPWIELGHLMPIPDQADPNNITPWDISGEAHAGEAVYADNGCAYCHTQQVRADTSGADIIRGWGTAVNDDNKVFTRRTYPRDYIWENQVFLGHSREGADLTNVGQRINTAEGIYRYLYDPDSLVPRSSMPAYRFLFTERRIQGAPAADAVVLPPSEAAPAGYEIVPTPSARALAAYLLSLKKDYDLPDGKGPIPPTPIGTSQ